MKKGLFFVLFGLITISSLGQGRIVLLRDTTRLNLSLAELEKKYPPALNRVTANAGITTEQKGAMGSNAKPFFDTLNKRQQRFFTYVEQNKRRLPVLGVMISTYEFIRPDGTYDWVFCEFSGKDITDEQEGQLLQFAAEWYGQHPFPIQTQTGFKWVGMSILGVVPQKRTVRRGPGIISTIEAAQKTTRPDTVTMLAFNQLELRNIPEIVYRFPKLEELDLSKNKLNELPARLTSDISTLKKLSLLYNAIPDDSVFFTRNNHLRSLNLQGNRLTRIPASVRLNRQLESLWMGNNELKGLDIKPLRPLRRLNDLNLYNTGLTQLPKAIGKLKHVKVLDLYYNKFTELPRQLGRMKRLEQLAIAHNNINELPTSLSKLRQLQVLFAHHNRLSQLPAELGRLKKLRVLDLGYNWYTTAPGVLSSLSSLEEVGLNNNQLQEFPSVLLSIKNLKKVYMGSNPLFGREAMNSPYASQIKQLEANNTQVTY
ncbi:leucine-rich repeat domain-containing protein [Spirosoma validum]|uniref:Leucine-rich repeat domain-containing protein n=1 Tax=Spirosoma validum TaxID=2771355 RepID=A0A927GDT1_9BACT|nr:leucine-rich repeat domain-containing protein [Spirosoma validum]MBD2753880.1 leucine-rich repeat domain-containing protein [Spirosoma validum]